MSQRFSWHSLKGRPVVNFTLRKMIDCALPVLTSTMHHAEKQFRAHSYREYRLIWWSDRASEVLTISAIGFAFWCIVGYFWPHFFSKYWLALVVWLGGCILFRRFARRRYYEQSLILDPPTSRSMYKSVFVEKVPQRWHAATKDAGIYEGKTVSECDPNYFHECNKPLSFFPALRSRLIEWRLSKRALQKSIESTQ